MHIFFRGVRVHKRKEFFAVSAEDIHTFFDIVEGKLTQHDDYDQWVCSLANAAGRKGTM